MRTLIIALALLLSHSAFAEQPCTPDKVAPGIGTKNYVWNKMTAERTEVLRLTGDVDRGRDAFRPCRGCHKSDGFGRVDGLYPRLTGQHASVIIKQVTDIRAGLRSNPKMAAFVEPDEVSTQDIADIAAFLSHETTIKENGKGPGDQVRMGEKLYVERGCVKCHGKRGEGSGEKLYPALAAQHYSYLLREMDMVKRGVRGNSHPDMVKALQDFSTEEMEAVADYLSRLPDYRQSGGQKGAR
jgi:cytochrome c553